MNEGCPDTNEGAETPGSGQDHVEEKLAQLATYATYGEDQAPFIPPTSALNGRPVVERPPLPDGPISHPWRALG